MGFNQHSSTGRSSDTGSTESNRLNPSLAAIVSAAVLFLTLSFCAAQNAQAELPAGYYTSMYLLTVLTEPDLQQPCVLLGESYSFTAHWVSDKDPDYKDTTYMTCGFFPDGEAMCAGYKGTWSVASNDYFRLEVKSDVYSYHVVYAGTVTAPDCFIEGTMARLDSPAYHGTFKAFQTTPDE